MSEFTFVPVTKLPSGIEIPYDEAANEEKMLKDQAYLKKLYPSKARLIIALVEDRCDRMEYEGSPMLQDIPDKESLLRVARDIYRMIYGTDSRDDEMHIIMSQLIETLVLNECILRRGRYQRRKRFF